MLQSQQVLKKEKKFGNPEAVIGTVESHGSAQTPLEGKGLPTRADLDEEFDGGNKVTGEISAPEDQIISVCINFKQM